MVLKWSLGMSINALEPIDWTAISEAQLDCIELTSQSSEWLTNQTVEHLNIQFDIAQKRKINVWSYHLPFGHAWDVSSLDNSSREQAMEHTSKLIETSRNWGIQRLVIHPSFEPISEHERNTRLLMASQSLGELARLASAQGVLLAAECLPRTCLGNCANEIQYLLANNNELTVCCDVNHLFHESPAQFIKSIGSRITTLHISDNDGLDEQHWYPGEGILKWNEIVSALLEVGYQGAFIYEVRDRNAKKVSNNWRDLIARYL